MQKFIRSFSYLFHPLFIPVYATLFYFFVAGKYFHNNEIYLVFVQVLILTVLLPISLFYLLQSLGRIKSKMMLDKKERRLPLTFYSLLLLMLVKHSFSSFAIPELYYYFVGVMISTVLALLLVLFSHKASLHMMGIAGFTVFVISIAAYYHISLTVFVAFFILCCGFVASSRLQAKAHSFSELILGTLLGILPQIGLWFIWLLK